MTRSYSTPIPVAKRAIKHLLGKGLMVKHSTQYHGKGCKRA